MRLSAEWAPPVSRGTIEDLTWASRLNDTQTAAAAERKLFAPFSLSGHK